MENETAVHLDGILSEFVAALNDEIQAIKSSGTSTTMLKEGHKIQSKGQGIWYQFKVDYMPSIPSDTPCKLTIGISEYMVTVVSGDEASIVLMSKDPMPDTIAKAQLQNGSTVLMEQLIKRIEQNAAKNNPAADRMLKAGVVPKGDAFSRIEQQPPMIDSQSGLTAGQKKAVRIALENDMTYIWGPPGTGKTSVISEIIMQLYRQRRSVLLVSHTNSAVDGAVIKFDRAYQEKYHPAPGDESPILRLGNAEVPEHLMMQHHVQVRGKNLQQEKIKLQLQRCVQEERKHAAERRIAQRNWCDRSRVDSLASLCQQITQRRTEKARIAASLSNAKNQFEQAKRLYPQGAQIEAEEIEIAEKQQEMAKGQDRYDSLAQNRVALQNQQTEALEAIEAWQRKEALQKELAQYPPILQLKKAITDETDALAKLSKEYAETQKESLALLAIIDDYMNAGVLGRVRKKKKYDQALLRRDEVDKAAGSLRSMVEASQKKLKTMRTSMDQTVRLTEEYAKLQPTGRLSSWVSTLERINRALSACDENISNELRKISDLRKTIDIKNASVSAGKKACAQYFAARDQVARQEQKKEAMLAIVNELQKRVTEQREQEEQLCASFYDCTGKSPEVIVQELSVLRKTIHDEARRTPRSVLQKQSAQAAEEIRRLNGEIRAVEGQISELERMIIRDTMVVGTTLAKSYLNDDIQSRDFDTVILDEASMASIPALWCACSVAKRNIVIVGDFLQLPPIVLAKTPCAKSWLGTDIFEKSGVKERIEKKRAPGNVALLTNQFRMEEQIAETANVLCYSRYNRLVSDDQAAHRVAAREAFHAWYPERKTDSAIRLVDTGELHAWCTGVKQGKSSSRINYYSAALVVSLAFKVIAKQLFAEPPREPLVLIIVPYRPQADLIRKMLVAEYQKYGISTKDGLPTFIRVGTVHSFQGKEADVVLFDLVVDEPHWHNNLFVPDDKAPNNQNLFNVAVTRARFKLFVIGNIAYCAKKAKDNVLGRMLTYFRQQGISPVDAKKLVPDLTVDVPSGIAVSEHLAAQHAWYRENEFDAYFRADLERAKNRVIIYSPFMTERRVSELLPCFDSMIGRGVAVVVITKNPGSGRAQQAQCEQILRQHGVHILHRYDMHEKIVFIDDDILWSGSLNVLSFTGGTNELMQRVSAEQGEKDNQITALAAMYDIEHILPAAFDDAQRKCPICGGEMVVRDSDDGGYYWSCVNKDFSRNTTQPHPVDGVLKCRKCGGDLEYSRKNEPRWVCVRDRKHYQKLGRYDIALSAMRQKVQPQSEIRFIEQYFNGKESVRS